MVSLVGVTGTVCGFRKNHHISPMIKIIIKAAPATKTISPFFFVLEPDIVGRGGNGGRVDAPVGGVDADGKLAEGKFIDAPPVIGDGGVAGRGGIGGNGLGGSGGKGGRDGGGLIGRAGIGGKFCCVSGSIF